jgi:hypothetical protein
MVTWFSLHFLAHERFWDVVNWDEVAKRFEKSLKSISN